MSNISMTITAMFRLTGAKKDGGVDDDGDDDIFLLLLMMMMMMAVRCLLVRWV